MLGEPIKNEPGTNGVQSEAMTTQRRKSSGGRSAGGSSRKVAAAPNASVANVEPIGDAREIYSLQRLLTNKKNPRTRDAAKLGDVLLPWFEKVIAKPGKKMEGIAELWDELVPAELCKHSRIQGFTRGTLNVSMASAPARAQLESLLRGGLLRQLQTGSRGAIYKVKTCVQGGLEPDA